MLAGLRRIASGQSDVDFVGKIRLWLTISGIVVGISLIGIFVIKLNFGLSFKGGTSLRAPLNTDATIPEIREAMLQAEVENAEVQIASSRTSDEREVLVQAKRIPPGPRLDEAQDALVEVAGLSSRSDVNIEDVGPKWGKQVTNKSIQALIVFLILVAVYISLRFELKMAACALGAVLHDLISTAGIYAVIGFEVSPATIVALLTILGYSLYDTVVVFDKIRENSATLVAGRQTYSQMVNRSVNEVFMRSINTSLTSLIPVAALLLAGRLFIGGAQQLTDLALAMLVGILVSSYSSIFFASPLLAKWKEREPRYHALQIRARKEAEKAPAYARPSVGTTTTAAGGGAATTTGAMTSSRSEGGDGGESERVPTSREPAPGPLGGGRTLAPRGRKQRRSKRKR